MKWVLLNPTEKELKNPDLFEKIINSKKHLVIIKKESKKTYVLLFKETYFPTLSLK